MTFPPYLLSFGDHASIVHRAWYHQPTTPSTTSHDKWPPIEVRKAHVDFDQFFISFVEGKGILWLQDRAASNSMHIQALPAPVCEGTSAESLG
jgi:hypothetical protein